MYEWPIPNTFHNLYLKRTIEMKAHRNNAISGKECDVMRSMESGNILIQSLYDPQIPLNYLIKIPYEILRLSNIS